MFTSDAVNLFAFFILATSVLANLTIIVPIVRMCETLKEPFL